MMINGADQLKAAAAPATVVLNSLSQAIHAAADQVLPAHDWGCQPHARVDDEGVGRWSRSGVLRVWWEKAMLPGQSWLRSGARLQCSRTTAPGGQARRGPLIGGGIVRSERP